MSDPVGILLINLGTPEATSFWPMRRYLKEFLSDRRVVEASGPIWWLVLNGIILTRRPKKSGRAYEKIWNRTLDESPLKTITRAQADGVALLLAGNPEIRVDWAMRYGRPSISDGIDRLVAQGCQRILFFPLYPQYSAATTATAMDTVFAALRELRHQPAMRCVPPYFDKADYISALAASIRDHQAGLEWKPDVILASFHGLPADFIARGDPYQNHCETTVDLLRTELGLDEKSLRLTYQSRSGRAVWIGPDTEATLAELAPTEAKKVLVVAPGFAADCIETLEEIEIRASQVFLGNGGSSFSYVPCLNESDASLTMLTRIIGKQLQGWTDIKP